MTVLEALKAKIAYPLSEPFFRTVLIERGLSATEEFTVTIAGSREFDLAKADALIALVAAPHVQEGNYSISTTEKSNILKMANALFNKYGQQGYGETPTDKPTITYRPDWQ